MHCSHCYKDAQFKCGSCLEHGYCGKDCQKLDWVNHKVECGLIEGKNDLEDKEDENVKIKRSKPQEEEGCVNKLDPFTQQNPEEDHFDMYLGNFKYCLDIDSCAIWFLKVAMDPELNTVDSKDFHLGYPESIRLFVKRYDSESAYWPKSVIPGLYFTKEVLLRFADEYDIYLSKYPEKRYKFNKYVIEFGLVDFSDILNSKEVEVKYNDIFNSYNSSIEKIFKPIRTNTLPYTWVDSVNINYGSIDEKQDYSVINLNRTFLNQSLEKWTRYKPFVIRINFKLKLEKLPTFILTLLLPDLKVERIAFNQMSFFYFIKFLFNTESRDFSNLIAGNVFNAMSDNYIGLYKLSFLFDYSVRVQTIEFLKVLLDPNSDLKNLNAWKTNLHVVFVELKKYYNTLSITPRWGSMVNQKEWELLIRINSHSM